MSYWTDPANPSPGALLGTVLGAAGGASQAGLSESEIDAEVDAAVERIGAPTLPTTPAEALDLDAIAAEWLVQCGPCDYGLVEMGCQCPSGDYRPVMARLVDEARRVRADERARVAEQIAQAIEATDHHPSAGCECDAQDAQALAAAIARQHATPSAEGEDHRGV